MALASHLHDAERGDGEDLILGLVGCHLTSHTVVHRVAIFLRFHIDEVEDDKSTDITQPYLATNLCRCLKVHLKDEVLAVFVFVLV